MATLIDEYRRIRKESPHYGAKTAFFIAKGNIKPLEFEWEDTRYGRDLEIRFATAVRDGFDIKVSVGYEPDRQNTYEETDDPSSGIRNPRFNHGGYYTDRHKPFLALESESTVRELAENYNGRYYGMAKGPAWEMAQATLREEAKRITKDDYTEYAIMVTASVDGTELGGDAIGGIDVGDVWGERFDREIEMILVDMNDMIGNAIDEARKALPEALASERVKVAHMEALAV